MKMINHKDILNLNISPSITYKWAYDMIFNKELSILPPKITLKPQDGVFCNVMPSIIKNGSESFAGIKIVTRYPARQPSLNSLIILFNAENGENLAVLDANWITAMRTGAVAAHSIELLAKKDFSTIGLVGLGNTAAATMLVLAELFPLKSFKVKLFMYKEQEKLFAKRFKHIKNYDFIFADSYERLVKGSDIVISAATYLPQDICSDDCFDEGVLVVPIHTLGFTNCDLFFDKIFADDYNHVCHFKYFEKFKSFAEISDVVKKREVGRENDMERILAYNIGLSIHDVYFASQIYKMLDKDKLLDLPLETPTEKFWL